ncbi:hypothetical protein DFH27DRAFT_618066 [Peziza echinospora]|nr:hypothetical protein DFH27DRAFT_618066 [Peziza echinospora]
MLTIPLRGLRDMPDVAPKPANPSNPPPNNATKPPPPSLRGTRRSTQKATTATTTTTSRKHISLTDMLPETPRKALTLTEMLPETPRKCLTLTDMLPESPPPPQAAAEAPAQGRENPQRQPSPERPTSDDDQAGPATPPTPPWLKGRQPTRTLPESDLRHLLEQLEARRLQRQRRFCGDPDPAEGVAGTAARQ